jgi:hypothetical protein
MADAPVIQWKNLDLNDYRQLMDPPADKAVSALITAQDFGNLRDLLRNMAANDSLVPGELPEPLREFLENELSQGFTAEDIKTFEIAREIWRENGVQFIFILFFRSLPYTYMAEKPANVLRLTKILETHPFRRIFETAQFIFDVMDKNWWLPENRGLLSALKIRLMHASMRFNLLFNPEGERWNRELWGMPISQEDLIATNQVFSLEFIKGMDILGEPLSEEQKQAWYHTWKKIGQIMGVQKELLCDTYQEAWTLQHAIYNHLFPDDNRAGIALAEALVRTLDTFLFSQKLVLILMKKMIMDTEHPDLFFRVLGPTYASEYPRLFARSRSAEEDAEDQEFLHQEFHAELVNYKEKVKKYREDQQATEPGARGDEPHLIDLQLDIFETIAGELDPTKPGTRGLKEELTKTAMRSMGSVVIGILSKHFRHGKDAGFRIPLDLKEHWALRDNP